VTVAPEWQGCGIGAAMLAALAGHLRAQRITRIDTACHRANTGAWRFYERLGFRPLDEERIALLL
jgi:ribosomal protein S18 acetylase RimI-like enzyme